ncbi:hypothetical protein BC828DRAFT_373192 [Blastocladiella britannica]|nr:hypothetical protein BC828DRAFT_373192 [Blastocladiella britannica]
MPPSNNPLETPVPSKSGAASASGDVLALLSRTGGAYMPPARLRALQAQITDKSSEAYQRMSWETLKKALNGLINKANVANIKDIVPDLINENLIRGRGLFCRSIIKSQATSLPFTPVYAAVVAVLNTKFPALAELLVVRLILLFRRAYKRNDKLACLAVTRFLAHLVNQRVAHEIVVLQILTLLLERPTDDAVEVAVGLMREVGAFLTEAQPRALSAIFDRFRAILHEAKLTVRAQYMIEVLFQLRREGFKDHPSVPRELDLVEEDDQVTHYLGLDDDDALDPQESTNIFKPDPDFVANEARYAQIKREILGSDDEEEEDGDDEKDESDAEEEEGDGDNKADKAFKAVEIEDETGADLVTLRKRIYLTIMSSLDFEECIHKLLKLNIPDQYEMELVNMVLDCCAQERTYKKFHGLIAERLCKLRRSWSDLFAQAFQEKYAIVHRFESTPLRNQARLFAHLFATDAVHWGALSCVRLTEDATTSSSRIFVKILFQEIKEDMGLAKLVTRLTAEPVLTPALQDMFPRDTPRNTRFAINYWTSIGLGAVTEDLRHWLLTAPPPAPLQAPQRSASSSGSSSGSSDSSSSGSDSYDSDESEDRYRSRRRSPSPVGRRFSPSPVGRRSPLRGVGRRSPSPGFGHRSPSPVGRGRSPSPVRRHRDSPSPVGRRRQPRSPIGRRSLSPAAPTQRLPRESSYPLMSPVRKSRRPSLSPSPSPPPLPRGRWDRSPPSPPPATRAYRRSPSPPPVRRPVHREASRPRSRSVEDDRHFRGRQNSPPPRSPVQGRGRGRNSPNPVPVRRRSSVSRSPSPPRKPHRRRRSSSSSRSRSRGRAPVRRPMRNESDASDQDDDEYGQDVKRRRL